jgi:hypothetical protein
MCHFNKPGYQGGPAGLVAGAETAAGIAVKIFVEEDQLPPVGIVGETAVDAMTGALPPAVAYEEVL